METKELIGKKIINLRNEIGTIVEVDKDGLIKIKFNDREAMFGSNAFDKGFLTFANEEVNHSIDKKILTTLSPESSLVVNHCLNELDSLVGLSSIKEIVRDMICQINISNLRKAFGLKCPEVTHHMVFIGNPGTGKTTVARVIAKIYKALGILSQGHLVEVDRSALVAGYQGQTAIKTKKVVSDALGGVLFIDEAYALCRDKDDDYGQEAIDTLVKVIEDKRNDLVVILAGYRDEMMRFLKLNPGLSSRFTTPIDFIDYSTDELYEIFQNLVNINDYIMSKEANEKLKVYLSKCQELEGNGRTIRNMFEETIRYQARRLNSVKEVNKKLLMTIKSEDLAFTKFI